MTAHAFPILRCAQERRRCPEGRRSVPWSWVEPYAEQARTNHDQSLERLAQRGGLGPDELYCIVHGLRLRAIYRGEVTHAIGEAWLATWDGTAPADLRAG